MGKVTFGEEFLLSLRMNGRGNGLWAILGIHELTVESVTSSPLITNLASVCFDM